MSYYSNPFRKRLLSFNVKTFTSSSIFLLLSTLLYVNTYNTEQIKQRILLTSNNNSNNNNNNTDPTCKLPACKEKKHDLKAALLSTTNSSSSNRNNLPPPPSKNEIGNAAWTILHSVAAHFPDQPTQEQIDSAKQFVLGFALLYPCEECRYGFIEYCKEHPPQFSSQKEFVIWVCNLHNTINEKLGKSVMMKCELNILNKRWLGDDE
jgi:FAD-linked sulfhydryl oxidase